MLAEVAPARASIMAPRMSVFSPLWRRTETLPEPDLWPRYPHIWVSEKHDICSCRGFKSVEAGRVRKFRRKPSRWMPPT